MKMCSSYLGYSVGDYHYEKMPIQIYRKFNLQKTENFQTKNFDIFHISAQNIDCGYSLEPPRRGGSNEYPQSMFLCRNKKNNVYPCKPQFDYIKMGFKGVKIIQVCFRDEIIRRITASNVLFERKIVSLHTRPFYFFATFTSLI